MDRISKTCLLTVLLVVPLAAFAGPHSNAGGHGHGGPGNAPADNGPGRGRGHGGPGQSGGPGGPPGGPGAQGPGSVGDDGDHGPGHGHGHGPGSLADGPARGKGLDDSRGGDDRRYDEGDADRREGNRGDGDGRGGSSRGNDSGDDDGAGRGNSQGALHANFHATQAVCRHQAAAAHSAIGVNCGGIIVGTDPRTGANVYSQTGMDVPNASQSTPTPAMGRKHKGR